MHLLIPFLILVFLSVYGCIQFVRHAQMHRLPVLVLVIKNGD